MCAAPLDDDVQLLMDLGTHTADARHSVQWLLSNVRGLRQACGELRAYIAAHRPTFFALTETHLDGDGVKPLLQGGYKTVARLDRSRHGGGLYTAAKTHVLVDKLDLTNYCTIREEEMVGIRSDVLDYLLCYTPKSSLVAKLLLAVQRYIMDNPER